VLSAANIAIDRLYHDNYLSVTFAQYLSWLHYKATRKICYTVKKKYIFDQ